MKNFLHKTFQYSKEIFLSLFFWSLVTTLILYKVVLVANGVFISSFWTFYGLVATTFLLSRIPYAYLHQDEHKNTYTALQYPNVSIVIAAKNEHDGIFKTISTCMDSKYEGKLECIVIDDGSTDGTKDEVIRAQKALGEDRIKLVVFGDNRGKREAMAVGINEAKYEIVTFIDSDSFVAPDGIHNIVEHFLDDKTIGAVSGNTKVYNIDTNLLTRIQSIQYAVSFDIYKASESVHSSVTCCPGCFSAYRKEAIEPLVEEWKEHRFFGSKATFGDDRGLTNFVLKEGWNVVYCQRAKATTKVPEKFSVYLRQQLRWKKSWIREGLFAGLFMWKKRHPLASLAFYIHFTFPILGPILAATVLVRSIQTHNPLLFLVFMFGFILLGTVFALFVRVYYGLPNWMYMPIFSLMFVSIFIWQMPYALFTLRQTHWGTR